jgi:hypothetical protein
MDNQIEKNIINQIKKGGLKRRSRFLFLIQKIGLGSVIVATILFAVLIFSFLLVYLRATGNLSFLSFGTTGLLVFLESFPFLLLGVFVLFILIVGFVFKKNNIVYKIPFTYLAVFLLLLVLFSGSVLAFGRFQEKIENGIIENYSKPFMKPFLHQPGEYTRKGLTGVVWEKGADYLLLKNMQGVYHLRVTDEKNKNILKDIKNNSLVTATGEWKEDFFEVKKIRFQKNNMPSRFSGNIHQFEKKGSTPRKECLKECYFLKKAPEDCLQECLK